MQGEFVTVDFETQIELENHAVTPVETDIPTPRSNSPTVKRASPGRVDTTPPPPQALSREEIIEKLAGSKGRKANAQNALRSEDENEQAEGEVMSDEHVGLKATQDEVDDVNNATTPFANFFEVEVEEDTPKGKTTVTKRKPIPQDNMVRELASRTGGFPKVLGEMPFAVVPGSSKPLFLDSPTDLKAWIDGAQGTGMNSLWASGIEFTPLPTFYARVRQSADQFEAVAHSPFYPERDRVYPVYGTLPPPSEDCHVFWELIGRFCPATPADKTLLAMAFLAPLFYSRSAKKPVIGIGTTDAQAAGKTTIANCIANLYDEGGDGAVQYTENDVSKGVEEFKKSLVEDVNLSRRCILFDNLRQGMKSDFFEALVTMGKIGARPAYAHHTVYRANDLTIFLTMNSMQFSTDGSTRTYVLRIKKPDEDPNASDRDRNWETVTMKYIEDNRLQILADALHMLRTAPRRRRQGSRFGVFDSVVLSAACRTDEEFAAADEAIRREQAQGNTDAEFASRLREKVEEFAARLDQYRPTVPIIMPRELVVRLARELEGGERKTSQDIAQLIREDLIPDASKEFEKLSPPHPRKVAFFFGMDKSEKYGMTDYQFISENNFHAPILLDTGRIHTPKR